MRGCLAYLVWLEDSHVEKNLTSAVYFPDELPHVERVPLPNFGIFPAITRI